jgi:hypothetical protein
VHSDRLRELLDTVRAGQTSVDAAIERLRHLPFESLGFATVDHHRTVRCGFPEVIFCEGKSSTQAAKIFEKLADAGGNVLATRARLKHYEKIARRFPEAEHHPAARCITYRQRPAQWSTGTIAIVSAGTSDERVAEEARLTAEIMDQRTATYYDVGVAGIHRLLAHTARLQQANVVIVVAGMEGALPSVVGGLVQAPVIAVPTSVGYGASFKGLAPLLTMLNSCAAGIAVVNIDNGFGAGYLAAMINRMAERARPGDNHPASPPE